MSDHIHDVFLSYSRKDIEMMRRVRTTLISAGLTVWTDEGIKSGTDLWIDSIETAIEQSGSVLVLLSPDSKKSRWVKKELRYAKIHGKKIFSLLLNGIPKTAIPFEIAGSQFVDIRTDYELLAQKLIPHIFDYLSINGIAQLQAELARERALNKELQAKIAEYEKDSISNIKKSYQEQADNLGKQAYKKLEKNNYFGAIEDYTIALFLDDKTNYYSYKSHRAGALRLMGNLKVAMAEFSSLANEYYKYDKYYEKLCWEIAEIAEELGDYDEAIMAYTIIYDLTEDNFEKENLYYLLQRLSQ